MKKNILTILIIFVCLFAIVPPTQASVVDEIINNLGIFNTGAQLPTNEQGIMPIIIGIINVVLAFLAITFIIMIIYAGFLYLTSAGTPDKTKKALDIIKNSVIGVAIVILAFIIVNYVITEIACIVNTGAGCERP